jgi:uncharacterized RDD family membrane protein YckC
MYCSACGNLLSLGARFCSACGAASPESDTLALALCEPSQFCPSCGLVQQASAHYCQQCSACSHCGVRRSPAPLPSALPGGQGSPTGDRVAAAIALDGLLIPYAMLYVLPFMPSMQVWWWSVLVLWCGNMVLGNITGQSLGKRLVHIRVVRAGSTAAPGLAQGLLRTAVYVLTGGPIGPRAFWALVGERGRGWHDLVAGTVVVRDTRPAQTQRLRRRPARAALP